MRSLVAAFVSIAFAMPGCRTRRAIPEAAAPTVQPGPSASYPPRLHVRFSETSIVPGEAPTQRWRENSLVLVRRELDGTAIYRDTTPGDPGFHEMFFSPTGSVGNVGSWDEANDRYAVYQPWQVILPANPTVGMQWQTAHRLGERLSSNPRRCAIEPSAMCVNGLISHCVSHMVSGRVVDASLHYCPSVGWVALYVDIYRDGRLTFQIRDDQVSDLP